MINILNKLPYTNHSFSRFLYTGVFMRGLAIIINFIFADYLSYNHRVVYLFILINDFFIGYTLNRYFVYKAKNSHKEVMLKFLLTGLVFRALDWVLYIVLVEKFELYLIFSQLISIITIMGMKYFTFKWVFK